MSKKWKKILDSGSLEFWTAYLEARGWCFVSQYPLHEDCAPVGWMDARQRHAGLSANEAVMVQWGMEVMVFGRGC